MPCVSLKHRKKYKATAMSAAQAQSVKSGKVVASEDVNRMSAEAARLVNAAKTPEYFEVALTDTTDSFLKTAITSAGVKLPRQPLARRLEMAILQPLLLKSLRHRVLKAARANTTSQSKQRKTKVRSRSQTAAEPSKQSTGPSEKTVKISDQTTSARLPQQPVVAKFQNLAPLSSLQNQPMPMPEGVDIPLRKPRHTAQITQTAQSARETSTKNQKSIRDTTKATAKVTQATKKLAQRSTQKSQKTAKRAQKVAAREVKNAQKNAIRTAKIAQKTALKATKLTQKTAKKSAKLARKQCRQAVDELVPTRILRRRPSRAELINAESRLGSTIFGPVPAGHRREFFHDQANVWIWHEAWDDGRTSHQITVRYEVRPAGVFKKVSTGKYTQLVGEELENFRRATHVYLHLIKQKLYQIQPAM